MGLLEYFTALDSRSKKELRHCRSLDETKMTRAYINITQRLEKHKIQWPYSQLEGIAVLLSMLSIINERTNDGGFIAGWAKCSVDKTPQRGMDINEHRFIKLIKSTDWSEFYDAVTLGVKIQLRDRRAVDVNDLEIWISKLAWEWQGGADEHGGFALRAADVFYQNQPKHRA